MNPILAHSGVDRHAAQKDMAKYDHAALTDGPRHLGQHPCRYPIRPMRYYFPHPVSVLADVSSNALDLQTNLSGEAQESTLLKKQINAEMFDTPAAGWGLIYE